MSSRDPMLGVWVLDLSGTSYQQGAPPKSATYRVDATEDGFRFEIEWVSPGGEKLHTSYEGVADGKIHPYDDPAVDAVSMARVSALQLDTTSYKDGRVLQHAARVLSDDANTLTVTQSGTAPTGENYRNVSVYRRRA